MRVVATSDTHFFVPDEVPIPDGDVFLHCGDLMYTGYIDEWEDKLTWLSRLRHKNKYLVPGNHDYHIAHFPGIACAEMRRRAKVNVLLPDNPVTKLPNGMTLLAIPFVTGLRGWAYNVAEEWLQDWLQALDIEPDVVMSHSPPWLILDSVAPDELDSYGLPSIKNSVGSQALSYWFSGLKKKPRAWFCGHIHESYGHVNIDGCDFYNVAMCDREYKQSNAPVVVDLGNTNE